MGFRSSDVLGAELVRFTVSFLIQIHSVCDTHDPVSSSRSADCSVGKISTFDARLGIVS